MIHKVSHKNNVHALAALQRGRVLFELIVVVMVLSGLFYPVVGRMRESRVDYEIAEINWTAAAIETAVQTEYARRSLSGLPLDGVNGGNPLRYLSRMPLNYEGELCNPDPGNFKGGNWYFDTCDQRLLYVFSREKFFAPGHPIVLKFKVESFRLLTEPAKQNSQSFHREKH